MTFIFGRRAVFGNVGSPGRGAFILPRRSTETKLLTLSQGTFSRESSGSYHNGSTSSLAWAPPNVLRSEDRGDGNGPVYLLEGAGENLVNAAIANWITTHTEGVITASAIVAPDNIGGADLIYLSGNTTAPNISRMVADLGQLTADVTFIHTIYAKQYETPQSFYLTARQGDGNQIDVLHSTSVDWERKETAWINDSGALANDIRIKQDDISDDYFYVWGAQCEESPFPTSYISSSNVTGSRAADSLYFESASVPAQIYDGRWYVDVYPYFSSAENSGKIKAIVAFSSALGRDEIRIGGDDLIVRINHATVVSLTALVWERHEKLRIWVDPSNGELALSSSTNGMKVAYGEPWTFPNTDRMYIGTRAGNTENNFFGRISDFYDANTDYLLDYNFATFTRESEASWWDGTELRWWDSGSARILSDGAIVVEGSRTNYALWSEHLDEMNVALATLDADATIAPDGTQTAERLNFEDVSTISRVQQSVTVSTGSYMLSAFVKRDTPDNIYRFGIIQSPGSNFISNNFHASASWRRDFFSSSAGVPTSIRFYNEGPLSASIHSLFVHGMQFETGSFGSSYIRTSGAAATRVADNCSFVSLPYEMRSGSWIVDIWPEFSSIEFLDLGLNSVIFSNTGTDALTFRRNGADATIRLRNAAGDLVDTGNIVFSANQKLRITCKMGEGILELSGATSGDGVFSGSSTVYWPTDNLDVGYTVSPNNLVFFGKISRPWKSGSTSIP